MPVHGKVAQFYSHVSGLATHTSSAEAMSTVIGSGNNTYYVIDDPDIRHLPGTNVTVYVGGAATSSDLYTVEKAGGRVVLQNTTAAAVTIDCDYYEMAAIGGGFNWSIDIDQDIVDAPQFASDWMKKVPGVRNWSLSFDRYWANDGFATLFQRGDKDIFVSAYMDISVGGQTKRFEGKGKLDTLGISAPSDAIVEENLVFSGEGTIYRRIGSQ